jgi:membrane associated rhomboid family serine protease
MPIISALDLRDSLGLSEKNTYQGEASPEVSRAVHGDAIRLTRGELKWALVCLAAVAILAVITRNVPQMWLVTLWPGMVVLTWTLRLSVRLFQLQRINPAATLQLEHQESAEHAAGVADFRARSATVTPIVTYGLMGLITLVTVVQLVQMFRGFPSLEAAALVKAAVRRGEWWRLLSASYLHAGLPHLVGNLAALRLLGGMVETYDQRSRVPLVYLVSVIGGSLASTLLTATTSLGASGGILGLVGYLVVVSGREQGRAPIWVRKRMLAMLGATAVYGIAGFFFIDNAAHLGGVVAGAAVGLVTIPRAHKASSLAWDRTIEALGWFSTMVLLGGAVFTTMQMLR